jgi:hypothetical protein
MPAQSLQMLFFSEAFSIPFYFLFFRYTLESYITRKSIPFLFSTLWALLLILTRGQLYWVIILVVICGMRLDNLSRTKVITYTALSCMIIVGGVQGGRHLQTLNYNYSQTKNPANLIVLSTAIYCSEPNDHLLFEAGSGERQLLESIRPSMDDPENPFAFSYETGNLTQRHNRFESEYDNLKERINKIYKQLISEGYDLSLLKITALLIIANPVSFFLHCGQNALVALIRTVAILRPVLNIYAISFFLLVIILLIVTRNNPSLLSARQFASLAILCSLLNALIMAPGVFALSRYVFYNMPIMYLAAFVLLNAIFRTFFQRHQSCVD